MQTRRYILGMMLMVSAAEPISAQTKDSLSGEVRNQNGRAIPLVVAEIRRDTAVLKEVSIVVRRNFMQIENDKKVFYPNAFGGVYSGSAADVLEHVPMINADADGNVTIRGKAAAILIDGKPSVFSDISTALQMIALAAII